MLVFSGLAAQAVSSKVLVKELLDFVSGWFATLVISSKVLLEVKEEQDEGRGEGGATLKGFTFGTFCTGCFSPVCETFFRRKSANEAAGLLVSGDAGDAGDADGPGGEMGAGGGGKVKECSCRSFVGGALNEGGGWTIERTLGRAAATKACLLQ